MRLFDARKGASKGVDTMIHVFQKLQEGWGMKLALSCIVSVAAEEHAQIFAAFVFLVCLDLVTKWLSLSRKCLIDHGTEEPTFWQSLTGIRNAQRLGYIRSEEMRKRFVHKILSYIGVVLSAVVLDFMLAHAHAPAFATSLTIGYLAITEFLSILENMQNSGVEEAGAIAELARKKGGIIKSTGDKPDERGEQ